MSVSKADTETTSEYRIKTFTGRAPSKEDLIREHSIYNYNTFDRENINLNTPHKSSQCSCEQVIQHNISKVIKKIDNSFSAMQSNFDNLFQVVANNSTMMKDLFTEISHLKSNLDQGQTNITFTQDQRERNVASPRQTSLKERSDPLMPISCKLVSEEDPAEGWNFSRAPDRRSNRHQEPEYIEVPKINPTLDYDKQLKEISSMTSVFNLSQTLEKNQEAPRTSRFENPYGLKDVGEKLENLKTVALESPDTTDLKLQSERIRSSLSAYLEDRSRRRNSCTSGRDKEDEVSSPKFMNFLNENKIAEGKENTLSSIPSEMKLENDGFCRNASPNRFKDRSRPVTREY